MICANIGVGILQRDLEKQKESSFIRLDLNYYNVLISHSHLIFGATSDKIFCWDEEGRIIRNWTIPCEPEALTIQNNILYARGTTNVLGYDLEGRLLVNQEVAFGSGISSSEGVLYVSSQDRIDCFRI